MAEFRDRLKQTRLEKGYQQNELSNKIDVPAIKISNLENGRTPPSIENLISICKVFNVSTDYMLGLSNIREQFWVDRFSEKAFLQGGQVVKFFGEGLNKTKNILYFTAYLQKNYPALNWSSGERPMGYISENISEIFCDGKNKIIWSRGSENSKTTKRIYIFDERDFSLEEEHHAN